MSRFVRVFTEDAYLNTLRRAPDGRSAETFISTLNIPNRGNVECYVKLCSCHRELFNEIAGYITAKALQLPCPDLGAVMTLPLSLFKDQQRFHTPQSRLAWVTTAVSQAANPKTVFRISDSFVAPEFLKDVRSWDKRYAVIALDDWTFNIDRNAGNLLRLSQGKYVLIDHGQLFGFPEIPTSAIDPKHPNPANKLTQMVFGQNAPEKTQVGHITSEAKKHDFAYRHAEAEVSDWAHRLLTSKEKSFALQFLKRRANESPERLSHYFGVLPV